MCLVSFPSFFPNKGKLEEALQWEEKARELDNEQQELWRKRVSTSIIASRWGGRGAQIDQMTASHTAELNALFVNQEMVRDECSNIDTQQILLNLIPYPNDAYPHRKRK